MNRKHRRRGFTLIELMVVIAIIALLAAIAIPRFVTARYRAYFSACLENERNLGTAMESYRHDSPDFPPDLNALITARIITKLPECPSAPGTPYQYQISADKSLCTVICAGYHQYQLPGQNPGFPQYVAGAGVITN